MSEIDEENGRLGRRSVLKAGVAAGVATAAWAAPSIRSASVVALDTSACTVPIQEFVSDSVQTNSSSNCAANTLLVYGSSGASVPVLGFGIGGSVTINADNPASSGTSTEPRCSVSPGPTYTIVPPTNSGLTCDVSAVEVFRQNNGQVIATVPVVTQGRMPEIPDPSINSSARVRAIIECCPTANYHP